MGLSVDLKAKNIRRVKIVVERDLIDGFADVQAFCYLFDRQRVPLMRGTLPTLPGTISTISHSDQSIQDPHAGVYSLPFTRS